MSELIHVSSPPTHMCVKLVSHTVGRNNRASECPADTGRPAQIFTPEQASWEEKHGPGHRVNTAHPSTGTPAPHVLQPQGTRCPTSPHSTPVNGRVLFRGVTL